MTDHIGNYVYFLHMPGTGNILKLDTRVWNLVGKEDECLRVAQGEYDAIRVMLPYGIKLEMCLNGRTIVLS